MLFEGEKFEEQPISPAKEVPEEKEEVEEAEEKVEIKPEEELKEIQEEIEKVKEEELREREKEEVEEKEEMIEKRELTSEEKEVLVDSWLKMVVSYREKPVDIEEWNNEKTEEWLYKSLMQDVEKLTEEWNLQPDNVLIQKIKEEKNPEEKAKLELEYIKSSHNEVDKIVQGFDRSKSTKWDSWPERMRETRQFNCVGASLLGINYLEKAGVQSYLGSPSGHSLNIVKLSNGDWWYVDFINGERNVRKIEPTETQLRDVPVLKLEDPNIDFRSIPLLENSGASGSVLRNLSSLKKVVESPEIPDEDIDKKEAVSYFSKFEEQFKKPNFSKLHQLLYPTLYELEETKEMEEEDAYIKRLRSFDRPAEEYIKTLTKSQEKDLVGNAKSNIEGIKKLFYEDNNNVLSIAKPELKRVLELYINNLKDIKKREPKAYKEMVNRLLNRMSNL